MKIVNCGYDYRHSADFRINRPHGSGDYLLLVLRSPAYCSLGGEKEILQENSVILFSAGTPQNYGGSEGEFVNDWVHFEADSEDLAWMHQLGLSFNTVIKSLNVLPLSMLIRQMFTEMYSENKNANESAHLLFRLLLLKLSDLCCGEKNVSDPLLREKLLREKLLRLKAEIFSNPQNDWSAERISGELLLSVSYLRHLYKKQFQRSIKEDVTSARLEYAKYLLFSTDDTVSAISQQCGYRNDVHFMRTFKEKIGMTPSEYRSRQVCSWDKRETAKERAPYCLL